MSAPQPAVCPASAFPSLLSAVALAPSTGTGVTVHVVGAGLAGLSAAVQLARQRRGQLEVSEAAAQAGGRCRSYYDPQLGLTLDNGNHLVLSGNTAVHAYLEAIGARDRLTGPDKAVFHWADLRSRRPLDASPQRRSPALVDALGQAADAGDPCGRPPVAPAPHAPRSPGGGWTR